MSALKEVINYIIKNLNQGYSEEAIREALLKAGYPSSIIGVSLREAKQELLRNSQEPARQSSQEPSRESLQQNPVNQQYNSGQQYPQYQGYQQHQQYQQYPQPYNEQVIRHEVKHQVRHEHEIKIPFKTIISILLIIITITSSILIIKNIGEANKTELLDVTTKIEPQVVNKGEETIIKTEIINMGSKERYDITINYELITPDGRVIKPIPAKTKAISTTLEVSEPLKIPTGVAEGEYTLKTIVTYGTDKKAISETIIKIVGNKENKGVDNDRMRSTGREENNNYETNNKENDSQEEKNKDNNTNDENNDEYQYYNSGNDIIVNPIIIDEGITETEDKIRSAKETAQNDDLSTAISSCEEISNEIQKNNCLTEIAASSKSPEPCTKIKNPDSQDSCLLGLMINGDLDDCSYFQQPENKVLCERMSQVNELSNNNTINTEEGDNQTITDDGQGEEEIPDINEFATKTE